VNKSPINILTRNLKGGSAVQQIEHDTGTWNYWLLLTLNCHLTYKICVSQDSAVVRRITITKSLEEILF